MDRTSVPFSGDELRSIFGLDPDDLVNAAAIEAVQAELSRQEAQERRSRCSTDQQDLTAQRDGLIGLGVAANRIHVDHGVVTRSAAARTKPRV